MAGRDVYTYVGNDPISRVDPSGLDGVSFFDDDSAPFDGNAEAAAAWSKGVYFVGAHGGVNKNGQYMNVGNVDRDGESDVAYFGTDRQVAKITASGYKGNMPLALMYCRAAANGNAAAMATKYEQSVIATEGYVGYPEMTNGVVTFTAGSGSENGKITGSATFTMFTPSGGKIEGLKSISVNQSTGKVTAVAEIYRTGSRLPRTLSVSCTAKDGCK